MTRKMGRPPKNPIDCCRTAYWAHFATWRTGLSLTAFELALKHLESPDEPSDGQDYRKSHVWSRYARGKIGRLADGSLGSGKGVLASANFSRKLLKNKDFLFYQIFTIESTINGALDMAPFF